MVLFSEIRIPKQQVATGVWVMLVSCQGQDINVTAGLRWVFGIGMEIADRNTVRVRASLANNGGRIG